MNADRNNSAPPVPTVPKISLLITTFQRDDLLRLGLASIARQNVPDLELLVVNDGTLGESEAIAAEHGARYLFTGQRNLESLHWRVPGFAINIAARAAKGEILIVTCAEMWHVGHCIESIAAPVRADRLALGIPEVRDDDGHYTESLDDDTCYRTLEKLDARLPFLLAIHRDSFFAIGGYDEDFTGQAFDDVDLIERLQLIGCRFVPTGARCVHLYHPRSEQPGRQGKDEPRWNYNRELYEERQGVAVRNAGRAWGVQ